jgi:hypothetical protein
MHFHSGNRARASISPGHHGLRRLTVRMADIAGMFSLFADWTPAPSHALLARQRKHGIECRGTNC